MNKKVLAALSAACMAAAITGTMTAYADDPVVLVYSDANAIDSVNGKEATFFKEKVEELTDGSVTIDIQASGVLGTESEILDGIVSYAGSADILRYSCYAFSSYGCDKSALLGLPFIFESEDHFWKFADSDLGQEILNEPAEKGLPVTGLFYLEDGFRSFFFSKEVSGIDDIKGKKLRVSQDQIMTGLVEGLGASPTVVNFNELYSSLQSGVVDGAEQPLPQYYSNAFYEVAPYVLLDEHTMATSSVIIANEAWDSLTEDQQEALKEAGKATQEYCKSLISEEITSAMSAAEEGGATFIPVEDKTPYREACTEVISSFTEGLEDVYQQILDFAK